MAWNYRILDFGTHRALHEVHYDAAGNPEGWTEEPATFVCDPDENASAITNALAMAAYDAGKLPVLRVAEGGRLVSANMVHKADITPMMVTAAVEKRMLEPAREIALRTRKQMMAKLPDDVIGRIGEAHIAFGAACAFEAMQGSNAS